MTGKEWVSHTVQRSVLTAVRPVSTSTSCSDPSWLKLLAGKSLCSCLWVWANLTIWLCMFRVSQANEGLWHQESASRNCAPSCTLACYVWYETNIHNAPQLYRCMALQIAAHWITVHDSTMHHSRYITSYHLTIYNVNSYHVIWYVFHIFIHRRSSSCCSAALCYRGSQRSFAWACLHGLSGGVKP